MKFQTTNQPLSMFSYSSLTDIVMLLLVFFLLTSHFVVQTGVKVALPDSKKTEKIDPSMMVVTIAANGEIYLGAELISLDRLSYGLESMKVNSRSKYLIIRSDKTVAIELLIKVIDAAKAAAIDKFTIETSKAD